MIYLGADILEIDPENMDSVIKIEINKYVKQVIIYKSKDKTQIVTNLVTGEPNAS